MISEEIQYYQESPTGDLFVLTYLHKLIKFTRQGEEYTRDIWLDIPHNTIRNFTFDKNGHILLPTGYILDPNTFEKLGRVALPPLHQLTYLPVKDIYLGSDNNNRELYVLTNYFSVLHKSNAEDGCIFPRINNTGNLIAYYSYDQDKKFYDLYELEIRPMLVTSFFDWDKKKSSDLKFNGNHFAVAYPESIAYYHNTTQLWEITAPNREMWYIPTIIEFISDDLLAVFKNKYVYILDIQRKKIVNTFTLTLQFNNEAGFPGQVRSVTTSLDKEHFIIITDVENILIKIKDVL